jgi:hypothetical protein
VLSPVALKSKSVPIPSLQEIVVENTKLVEMETAALSQVLAPELFAAFFAAWQKVLSKQEHVFNTFETTRNEAGFKEFLLKNF